MLKNQPNKQTNNKLSIFGYYFYNSSSLPPLWHIKSELMWCFYCQVTHSDMHTVIWWAAHHACKRPAQPLKTIWLWLAHFRIPVLHTEWRGTIVATSKWKTNTNMCIRTNSKLICKKKKSFSLHYCAVLLKGHYFSLLMPCNPVKQLDCRDSRLN